jgi:uncharacterized protein (DUF427 family)
MNTVIRARSSGLVLAEAETPGPGLVPYEGNLYFAPEAVHGDVLRTTERTYTCPYKGTCHWVDHVAPDGQVARDVAWIYADPKPGHEIIRGRYGFYAGSRGPTVQEG